MPAKMVDITGKSETYREAIATGLIKLKRETLELIKKGAIEKGDVLTVSTVATINAVKLTPHVLPLTHNIPVTGVNVEFKFEEDGIRVYVSVKTTAKTGVEMEALLGALVALLNVWDMVKKYEKDETGQYPHTAITDVRVLKKVKGGAIVEGDH